MLARGGGEVELLTSKEMNEIIFVQSVFSFILYAFFSLSFFFFFIILLIGMEKFLCVPSYVTLHHNLN